MNLAAANIEIGEVESKEDKYTVTQVNDSIETFRLKTHAPNQPTRGRNATQAGRSMNISLVSTGRLQLTTDEYSITN